MAKCDEGYVCEVCGKYVHDITDSDLYLRYVLGEIDGRQLMTAPERHLRCNPTLTQFIVDKSFTPVVANGAFAKDQLDADDVAAREELVTRAWRRLQEVRELGIAIAEYPLPEVRNAR